MAASRSANWFLTFWLLAWGAFTLYFDATIARTIYRQVAASSFPKTPGIVTESRVASRPGHKKRTYIAVIKFRYTVSAHEYEGTRWRYGQWSGWESLAATVTRRFPVGASVNVHYNPASPDDSVLMAGMQGMDAFLLLLVASINAALIGTGLVAAGKWPGIGPYSARNRRAVLARASGKGWRHTLPASMIGLGVAGVASLGAAVVIRLTVGLDPAPAISLASLAGALGLGLVTYVWQRLRQAAGHADLLME